MTLLNSKIKSTIFLTDGGLETDLIFNKNISLPHFAAFPLVEDPKYQQVLNDYYREYMDIAAKQGTGFILESPTWRANPDWGYKLGYSKEDLMEINQSAIHQLKILKRIYTPKIKNIFISGQLGPRGDGYRTINTMTVNEAANYHNLQIMAFKNSDVDLVTAITMNYSEEALGITKAAKKSNLSVVISFTVETDGNLPSGETLKEAISKIDKATNNYPIYYMINCAHPSHFINKINVDGSWKHRIKGVRANASCKSHAELDESTELDKGDKTELGDWHTILKKHLPNLAVYGGCCGTDSSHIQSICNYIMNPEHIKYLQSNS